MSLEQEKYVKELEKQVRDLSFVHGVCDRFGSYLSLKKDVELIWFFLRKKDHVARWVEVIHVFMRRGWAKSTVENHLRNLLRIGVLVKGGLPGEYVLDRSLSEDMDELARWVLGDIYRLARESWRNKVYY